MKLFYFVDQTIRFPDYSEPQRIVRALAQSLIAAGHEVSFVTWCADRKAIILLEQQYLKNIFSRIGPILSAEQIRSYPADKETAILVEENSAESAAFQWLLIPEILHSQLVSFRTNDLLDYCVQHRLRTAFLFHDAIWLKYPYYADLQQQHAEYVQQLVFADLILPISVQAAEDLVSFYLNRCYFRTENLPPIAPLQLPSEILDQERRIPDAEHKPTGNILSVGPIEPQNNHLQLLRLFKKFCLDFPESEIKLFLTGDIHPSIKGEIEAALLENPKVHHLLDIDREKLDECYEKCDFTISPSIEGSSVFPIIQSLWMGKPCLCANFGSAATLAEGGGCLTVDMLSETAFFSGISKLILKPNLLTQLRNELRERKYSRWTEYTQTLTGQLKNQSAPQTRIKKIFYWVDHTQHYPANSGIQRVVRGLASVLQKTDIPVTPVAWNSKAGDFAVADQTGLEHLEKWTGPQENLWNLTSPGSDESGAWLIVSELITYANAPAVNKIIQQAKRRGMRTAIIFFDAIPYKMSELYPIEAQLAHADYMRTLPLFDRVLCISNQSKSDLWNYLRSNLERLVNVDHRLRAILLPAEFPEIERQLDPRASTRKGDTISILSVGTLEPRKNQITLLQAFQQAKLTTKVPLKLILAGQAPFPDIEKIVREYCEKDSDIIWMPHPDDRVLHDLYLSCDFTVYPSLEEGFGLPILESLWYARPCICRNASSMKEIAEEGGCVLVETANPEVLAQAIVDLVANPAVLAQLRDEATSRTFKTWKEYGDEVLAELVASSEWRANIFPPAHVMPSRSVFHAPILSICISTYNRASWLALSLPLLLKQTARYRDIVEVIVCDNTSTDETPQVVEPYLSESGFRYIRNPENVGMLGNLKVTAQSTQGQYVWILGDDDLLQYGAVEKALKAIIEHPEVSLVYLNYAYTTIADADKAKNIDKHLRDGVPIRPPTQDLYAPISKIAAVCENFFTAIYCLIFRRDHALRAYSQNTQGRPFSTMLTCIPTSYYVCQHMMNEAGYWVGTPSLVVNMNVSWGKYAPLWVLERLPELYDLAELKGANPAEIDHWRTHNLPGALHFLEKIYFEDTENNQQYFSMERFIARHKHLPAFRSKLSEFMAIYQKAGRIGLQKHSASATSLLVRFGLTHTDR